MRLEEELLQQANDLEPGEDTGRVLVLLSGVVDMARRIAGNVGDAYYRRAKGLQLVDDALMLVVALAELDTGGLDDDAYEAVGRRHRAWADEALAGAAARFDEAS